MEKINVYAKKLFQDTIEKIGHVKIILIGEIHGTMEIPLILKEYFKLIENSFEFNIAVEIPSNYQKKMDLFLSTGKTKIISETNFFRNRDDGKNGLEFLELLKSFCYLKNANVFCVDVNENSFNGTQQERENIIAKNILKIGSKNKIFAILGNVHAGNFKNGFKSAGYIIKKAGSGEVFNVNLAPLSGEFYNFGFKKVKFKECVKKEDFFDYTIYIKEINSANIYSKTSFRKSISK